MRLRSRRHDTPTADDSFSLDTNATFVGLWTSISSTFFFVVIGIASISLVVGGVGKIAGSVVAALGLGTINKLLEPFAGAVLGKIFLLVFVVLFIQRRPQGLFALKGRSAEG